MMEALNTVIINAATTVLIVSTCVWICRAFKWAPVNIVLKIEVIVPREGEPRTITHGPVEFRDAA